VIALAVALAHGVRRRPTAASHWQTRACRMQPPSYMRDDTKTEETAIVVSKPSESGKAGWALLWLLGIPLPVLLVAYLFTRGC
jgi:hypothetical protein